MSGRVTDTKGAPLAKVAIGLRTPYLEMDYQGTVIRNVQKMALVALTDEDGRYTLHNVPLQDVWIHFETDGREPFESRALAESETGETRELNVVLPLFVRLRVELDDPAEAQRFWVLDADGDEMNLNPNGELRFVTAELRRELFAGRSPVFLLPERGRTLILMNGEDEVRRIGLDLAADTLNVIR